jgi:hypothetical protein
MPDELRVAPGKMNDREERDDRAERAAGTGRCMLRAELSVLIRARAAASIPTDASTPM